MRLFGPTIFALSVVTVACSNQEFKGSEARKAVVKSCPSNDTRCKSPGLDPPATPPTALQSHEAVFAVRNLSCALCHAKIESNVISDFAANTGAASAAQSFTDLFFVVLSSEGAKRPPAINGKFVIPSGDIDAHSSSINSADGKSNCSYDGLNSASPTYKKTNLSAALKTCIEPKINWGSGSEKFIARSKVSINPVASPDTVKGIAGSETEAAALTGKGYAAIGTSTIDGITGSKVNGFKAGDAVKCEGAIVFDAPVLLQDTMIKTQSGCRIYSTASIFVFGGLSVDGPENSSHLQLMSPVFVGFDISLEKITERLNHTLANKQAFSRGTPSQLASLISADAKLLAIDKVPGSGSKDYRRVAVSAPVVYSRSSGQFSGVIVAEQFLGKIGALAFVFDPVFKSRADGPAIFPEIKTDMVTVSDDAGSL